MKTKNRIIYFLSVFLKRVGSWTNWGKIALDTAFQLSERININERTKEVTIILSNKEEDEYKDNS